MNSVDSLQLNAYMSNSTLMSENMNINASIKNNAPLKTEENLDKNGSDINNAAVNVSISMQSMLVYVHVRSLEFVQNNTEAQNMLDNIFSNKDVFRFLDGREAENGIDLKEIGYDGKPITQLSVDEAKELVSNEGFFGVDKTSQRVADFTINLSGDDVELLKEARSGLVKGFEEAEKLWGGELPEISYETQEKTLEIVDKRIEELLNKNSNPKEDKEFFDDVVSEDSTKEEKKEKEN